MGVGGTIPRTIAKASFYIIGPRVQVAGSSQLCIGQESGYEAVAHAMRKIFNDDSTEAHANNAFNCLNRRSMLRNIHVLCPAFATVLICKQRSSAELFVDGETILSQEGTTQGDPLVMSMYVLGIFPLIKQLTISPSRYGSKMTHLLEANWFNYTSGEICLCHCGSWPWLWLLC